MNMQKEPLAIVGTIGSLIGAFLVMMQSFGIPITDAQSDAINNFVVIAAPIIVALVGRQFVWSPNSVDNLTDRAYMAGLPPSDPKPEVPKPPME